MGAEWGGESRDILRYVVLYVVLDYSMVREYTFQDSGPVITRMRPARGDYPLALSTTLCCL